MFNPLIKPVLFCFAVQLAAAATTDQVIRSVADKVVAETSFALRDRTTQKEIISSEDLSAEADAVLPSRWNQWFYAAMLAGEGLKYVGEETGMEAYRTFQAKQVSCIVAHAAWFKRSWEHSGKKPDGAARLGHFINFRSLWTTGLAGPYIATYYATQDPRMADYVKRFQQLVEHHPRDADGLLLENGSVRTDDIYLMLPGMFSLGVGSGQSAFMEDAVQLVLGGHKRLFDRERQLHRQSWNSKTGKFDGDFWGRGAGWMTLAETELLSRLDKRHPRYAEALSAFRETLAGLRRWQAPDGGWRQVLDEETAWVETSCTGMFTYAMARGVCEGWLPGDYAVEARKGWALLATKVLKDGTLIDICPATGQGNRAHYLGRPRAKDDVHGYGPFLLAGSQILRLDKLAASNPH